MDTFESESKFLRLVLLTINADASRCLCSSTAEAVCSMLQRKRVVGYPDCLKLTGIVKVLPLVAFCPEGRTH